jgi:hypothetical protein
VAEKVSEAHTRGAIDRVTRRFVEQAQKEGRQTSHEKERDKAIKLAINHDRNRGK